MRNRILILCNVRQTSLVMIEAEHGAMYDRGFWDCISVESRIT